MNWLIVFMLVTPAIVMWLGVYVCRRTGRYRGRRVRDAGADIFRSVDTTHPWSDPESDPMADLARWASLRPRPSTPDWVPALALVSSVHVHSGTSGGALHAVVGSLVNPRTMVEQGWDIRTDGDRLRAVSPNGLVEQVLTPFARA